MTFVGLNKMPSQMAKFSGNGADSLLSNACLVELPDRKAACAVTRNVAPVRIPTLGIRSPMK
ncbi:hypothetical protein PLUA15_70001 [Pseudomonas lundensis]|uniref:Uncharacterized protein n=1 Tax=Pseudomonas lundensis TaxID=86185 RepID=A0AAX2HDY8_9PSED|nr:hypothetical protein PLUA15_70001 [Pseudomonas lundensis]